MSITPLIRYLSYLLVVVAMNSLQAIAQEPDDISKQQSRIDFGNSYIQGQSVKSGAVYLTNRRKSEIKSLLKIREHYRVEILKSFDADKTKALDSNVNSE